MRRSILFIIGFCIGSLGIAFAVDIGFVPAAPQATDSYPRKLDKEAVAMAPDLYANIATSGTTVLSGSAGKLDRVTIGIPGAAGANVILFDGTTPIATCATTAAGTFPFNAALKSGTLSAVITGTANLTILYR